MINAIRSLLANRGRDGTSPSFPGEEFIDPSFVPRKHPQGLRRAMVQLLGQNPDRLYLNYRIQQVMKLLHSTELQEFVFTLDSRVTYLPINSTVFLEGVFGHRVQQYAGANVVPLTVNGVHQADEGVGQTMLKWKLHVLDDTQIQIDRLTPPVLMDQITTYGQSKGLSDYIVLPGSDLIVKFPTADAVGVKWMVESAARPHQDLGLRISKLIQATDDETLTAIFGLREEPTLTLRKSFEDNTLFPYKASAILLAMAFYMDTLPQES
jgi:hypothetical protein